MKTLVWIGIAVMIVAGLVVGGLTAGWALLGHGIWNVTPAYAVGQATRDSNIEAGLSQQRWCHWQGRADDRAEPVSIEQALEAVERYLEARGWGDLQVAEVMEFELNFYAIAREPDTGIGAMELLVDKGTGAVGPEMGPNMMWNARYGMHAGRARRRSAGRNVISEAEVLDIAASWVEVNLPNMGIEGHADPFYGYYTIHTLEDGEVAGMLSVHGVTGHVWYHNWHGAFIQMIEPDPHD